MWLAHPVSVRGIVQAYIRPHRGQRGFKRARKARDKYFAERSKKETSGDGGGERAIYSSFSEREGCGCPNQDLLAILAATGKAGRDTHLTNHSNFSSRLLTRTANRRERSGSSTCSRNRKSTGPSEPALDTRETTFLPAIFVCGLVVLSCCCCRDRIFFWLEVTTRFEPQTWHAPRFALDHVQSYMVIFTWSILYPCTYFCD